MALEAEEFTIPAFLENSSEDEIHKKMLDNLPEDIDKSEGGFPWDLTRPTAIEISELREYVLAEVLKSLFPSTCEESYLLDLHGSSSGITRRESVNATGYVTVTAAAGTVIPLGYIFSTEADEDGNTVSFVTTEEITVDSSGTASVPVEAEEGGTEGNVLPNTVVLQVGDEAGNILDEITSVTNPERMSGGIDEEDDDDYRERIVEYSQSRDISHVGNTADYKRWALSVPGIGSVTVIPAEDESATVTLILTDQDGNPANKSLRDAVYNYIMAPDNPDDRLVPLGGVKLVIKEPEAATVDLSLTVYLDGITKEQAKTAIETGITEYLTSCVKDGVVRLSGVYGVLSGVTGIYDYADVQLFSTQAMATSSGNLTVPAGMIPVLGTLTLTEGA